VQVRGKGDETDSTASAGRPAMGWRRPRPAHVAALGVFSLAGLLFATSAEIARGTDLRPGARTDLPDLIRGEQARVEEQSREVAELQSTVAELTADARGDAADGEQERLDELALAAGLQPVEGPGLRITLSDSPLRLGDPALPDDTEPDDLVVHQQDLQGVVNALWAGGAEAMQLMDQRVISTSAVRCVGNTLILQGRVYSPPYVVTAIGPQEEMQAAVDASEAVSLYRQYVELVRLGYEEEELGEVTLPAYEGGLRLLNATPGDGDAGEDEG
jgi:uncharacterized protein YlxW (UPF0749 family)